MNTTFEKLYLDWYKSTCFSAIMTHDNIYYKALEKWCCENKEEATECFKELLLEEPSHAVDILDKMYPDMLKIEGYIGLEPYCNMWLNILCNKEIFMNKDSSKKKKHIKIFDYYKDYKAYHKYMKNHYIPWNPFHEDDPNITLEEFKQGKRNKKK